MASPRAPVEESVFVPYIFSREEVAAVIDVATWHEGCNTWGGMLRALTLVLYCTGMRLSAHSALVARIRPDFAADRA